jgi:hypothetical protein
MPIDVCSPVSRKGSKVGSNPPLTASIHRDPGRDDSVPSPSPYKAAKHSEHPATLHVTGPDDD